MATTNRRASSSFKALPLPSYVRFIFVFASATKEKGISCASYALCIVPATYVFRLSSYHAQCPIAAYHRQNLSPSAIYHTFHQFTSTKYTPPSSHQVISRHPSPYLHSSSSPFRLPLHLPTSQPRFRSCLAPPSPAVSAPPNAEGPLPLYYLDLL